MIKHITAKQLKEYINDCWTSRQISELLNIQSFDDSLHENKDKWDIEKGKIEWHIWDEVSRKWFVDTSGLFTENKMKVMIHHLRGFMFGEILEDDNIDEIWDTLKYWLDIRLRERQEFLDKLESINE